MKAVILIAIVLVALVVYTQAQGCANQPRDPECRGPRNEGRGGGNCNVGRRFFFDEDSRSCREMRYLGCGGNRNRFCSLRECQQTCRRGGEGEGEGGRCGNQPNNPTCRGRRDEGRGGNNCHAGRRFFFDNESRSCREMHYRGCGGNSNRFCSRRDCQQSCRRDGGGEGGGENGGEGGGN